MLLRVQELAEQPLEISDLGAADDVAQSAVLHFIADWVTGDADSAREHIADHADGGGTTLVATIGEDVAGLVTVRWRSENPDFAERGIPLVHQVSVAEQFRRRGIASALMDAAEAAATAGSKPTIGITVGLFDEYGPAQRLYAKRGYVPDGRGACKGRVPLRQGETVVVDHDLIVWLTKDLQAPS